MADLTQGVTAPKAAGLPGASGFGPTPPNAQRVNLSNAAFSVAGPGNNTAIPNTPIWKYAEPGTGIATFTNIAPHLPQAPAAPPAPTASAAPAAPVASPAASQSTPLSALTMPLSHPAASPSDLSPMSVLNRAPGVLGDYTGAATPPQSQQYDSAMGIPSQPQTHIGQLLHNIYKSLLSPQPEMDVLGLNRSIVPSLGGDPLGLGQPSNSQSPYPGNV